MDIVDKMVFNAMKARSTRNKLDTEIEMEPDFKICLEIHYLLLEVKAEQFLSLKKVLR